MKRRDLIAILGGTVVAWPQAARVQQRAIPVVGALSTAPSDPRLSREFRRGLAEYGFVEGQSVVIDSRWPEGDPERLPSLAAGLVERHVSVIAATGGVATAVAAKNATSTIPIVFVVADDPVRDGLVASLGAPKGNLTGIALLRTETTLKQIELLNELIANKAPIAVLIDPISDMSALETKAGSLGGRLDRKVVFARAATPEEFTTAFDALSRQHVAGVVIPGGPLFSSRQAHAQLAALAARYSLPAIYPDPDADLSVSNGLMSYGAPLLDMFRLVGTYVGEILKGAKPEDLPVQQPTKIVLKVNLKTAKSLGIIVPTSILVRADEVIE